MSEPTAVALSARGISVEFGKSRVLHAAGLELDRGRVTALVGPNGSGKSTLLRAISRLVVPVSGSIELGGEAVDAMALSAREFARWVTLLSQQRPVPVGITVRDIVEFGRHPHRSLWRGHDPEGGEAVRNALAVTGLEALAEARLETLSGGQLQRAWFASALAQQTEVLLLDEPTNHLDLRYQVEVLELIRSLADQHDVAVGVVLHDLNHAVDIADRVVVLEEGKVVIADTPSRALNAELLSRVWELPIQVSRDSEGFLEVRARRARLTQPVL
ncbi:ABC transporter ATP-binding protein [Tsukamurella tyrosinosolvens]|uniref:ABC transporter ATP-binding protein n=1 Tax=Tsukamurella tyrosinosolvens TaxID=57704 RepID=UPI00368747C9